MRVHLLSLVTCLGLCSLAHAQAGVVAVAGGDAPVRIETHGEADPADRFYVASVSKTFTAACVHLLVAAGELDLDDPLAKHVPELTAATAGVTLRHALHHRSGIRDFYELLILRGHDPLEPPPRDEIIALLARQRGSCFAPGRDAGYSNSNYLLLALVVERVAGVPFHAFASERLFEPLGMTSTAFAPPERAAELRNPLVGAGGAWSTAEDLVRFAAVFTDARWREVAAGLTAAPDLGKDEWLHPTLGDYRGGTIRRVFGGASAFGHAGGYGDWRAELLVAPALGIAAAGVARGHDVPLADLVLDAAHATGLPRATHEPVETAATPAPASRLLRARDGGALGMLATRGAEGVFQSLGLELHLTARDASTLAADNAAFPVDAVLVDDGDGVELRTSGKHARRFDVIDAERFTADDADAVAGTYWSDELDASLELVAGVRGLVLGGKAFAVPVPAFRPLSRDIHVSPGRVMILIQVVRDADGAVTGCVLGTGRARGLRFEKI